MSDLVVCGVYFQCCFRLGWVLLRCFSYSSKVDESICRLCGLPLCFSPCPGHPLCFAKHCCVSSHWKSPWPRTAGVYKKPSQKLFLLQLCMAWLKNVTCLSHKQETALVGTERGQKPNPNSAVSHLHMLLSVPRKFGKHGCNCLPHAG